LPQFPLKVGVENFLDLFVKNERKNCNNLPKKVKKYYLMYLIFIYRRIYITFPCGYNKVPVQLQQIYHLFNVLSFLRFPP